MAQPSADEAGSDIRFEQMGGRRMAKAVSGQPFCAQRRTLRGCPLHVFLDDGANAEPRKGPAALVDKEDVQGGRMRFAPVVAFIKLKELNGGGPKRGQALFLALAKKIGGVIGEIDSREPEVGHLLGAGAGIIKEGKNAEIPETIGRRQDRLSENQVQFLSIESGRGERRGAFDGNGQDSFGLRFQRGMKERGVSEEGLNGRQALVAGGNGIFPMLFQILKEIQDRFHVDLLDGQPGRRTVMGTEVGNQKLEGVPVTFDGVRADFSLIPKKGVEELVEVMAEIHQRFFFLLRNFLTTSSKAAWNRRSPSRRRA